MGIILQHKNLLLLVFLFVVISSKTLAGILTGNECINYTTLNEVNRSRFFSSELLTASSDRSLKEWFAFNGSAGNRIATSCVESRHCGTDAPGWMPGEHPKAEEGVVRRSACFSAKQLCCMESVGLLVRNCSGFYVYKLIAIPSSVEYNFRVCGTGIEGSTPSAGTGNNKTSDNTTDGCIDYNRLDERDRAADYFSYHTMKCDANLPQSWFRFTGRAGTVMPTNCVPKLHCGTLSPGWLNDNHPSVGEGVVTRMVCFTKDDNCCFWYSSVMVRNCSDYIVYKFGQFPILQHFCSLRYCGAGNEGCKDKDGNTYQVHQTWKPNPLVTCNCSPDFKVQCSKTQNGCWDEKGKAYVDGQEWLSNSTTKCICGNEKISCTRLSRPACADENGVVREHGTNWFPGACFNCSCRDGYMSCTKYHVTIQYGLFTVNTVGHCLPCRHPRDDIRPAGNGTVSNCQVFFQLKNRADELFQCSDGAYIRSRHVCNGITECSDGSDEYACHNVICRDEDGQSLILKEPWHVTDCIKCQCVAELLKCQRRLQVNFPGRHGAYVPLIEECDQPDCNTVQFIRDRRHKCEAIETISGRHILVEGETWEYQGCKFQFTGEKKIQGCPKMVGPWCHMYNGAVCCARKCTGLPGLASQVRWNATICPGGLQLKARDDLCDTPMPNCLFSNNFCETNVTCRDEKSNLYFEGAYWSVGDCITCKCSKGFISCSQKLTFMTSADQHIEHCRQPDCNVAAFWNSQKGICKACSWKNQTLLDGYRWKENGVDFFCSSNERVRPGCYLYTDKISCTGAFTGIQDLGLISDEKLFLCESGDEIRSLNDRCNKIDECDDISDEKDCAQYFCPSHVKFNLSWNRTVVDSVVRRKCYEVDGKLGGTFSKNLSLPSTTPWEFSSRCRSSGRTYWQHKQSCGCEKKVLLQQFKSMLSSVNMSNLLEVTRRLAREAVNFTNKEVFFNFLNALFQAGVYQLTPVSLQNDMEALNFSRALFSIAGDDDNFKTFPDSFCPQVVTVNQRHSLRLNVKQFCCQAPNLTLTYQFCRLPYSLLAPQYVVSRGKTSQRPIHGITVFWRRPVLMLKIDPSQLSSGNEVRSLSAFPSGNRSNVENNSNVFSHDSQQANCSWLEYDGNGTLKIKDQELRDEDQEQKSFIQGYLELALSSISTVAVIISLIVLSCLRMRNSERIFVHKNLLVSLCLVYIVMIFDTFVFTNRKQTPKLCSAMAVIQHVTHVAIFTWMLVEGIHLYIKLVKVFSVNKLYVTYIIIGWGLPLVIVGLIAAIRPQTYDMSKTYYKDVMCGSLKFSAEIIRNRCWLHDGEWLYKGPILAILLVNVAIFMVLLKVIFTKISVKYQKDKVQMAKRGLKSVAALLPLLGVTWLLGFVVQLNEVLLYLFIILNSTQGLLFCVFHSFLDDQIRERLIRSIRRSRMSQLLRDHTPSVASVTTQLSPAGSVSGKEQAKQRQSIEASTTKPFETKL